MGISEKSLELNVGAELLQVIRDEWGYPKAYLRGLTQREERQEGVDFSVQLDPETRLLAFQFKAPRGPLEGPPYRYTLRKVQHSALYDLAQLARGSVFYVFPYFVTLAKLQAVVPNLSQDTWLLDVALVPPADLFSGFQTRTVRCQGDRAEINPAYALMKLGAQSPVQQRGIALRDFTQWYHHFQDNRGLLEQRQDPWLARGLRIVIIPPGNEAAG
jgi:hypothetical protein